MLPFHSQCCRTNTDEDHDDNEGNNNEHWSQWRCSSVLPGHWDENQESPDIKDVSHWSLINSKSQPKWHIPPPHPLHFYNQLFATKLQGTFGYRRERKISHLHIRLIAPQKAVSHDSTLLFCTTEQSTERHPYRWEENEVHYASKRHTWCVITQLLLLMATGYHPQRRLPSAWQLNTPSTLPSVFTAKKKKKKWRCSYPTRTLLQPCFLAHFPNIQKITWVKHSGELH